MSSEALRLQIQRTCDAAPVQYEGTIEGRPFYFRARHDRWFFAVAATLDEAVAAPDPTLVEAIAAPSPDEANSSDTPLCGPFVRAALWGDGPFAASFMPVEEAERIIHVCAEEYMEATNRDA